MRTSPVCLACLSWPEVLDEVFIWLESVVSVLLCTKCGLFYKSCYSKLKVLLWRSKKKMFIAAAAAAKSLQACLTLCDPIDSSPPDSSVPGILQARILEWVAISFSNAWKWKVREVAQSCPTLSDPMDCSPPGSSVHGTFQARVPEWGAIAFSGKFYKTLLIRLYVFCLFSSFQNIIEIQYTCNKQNTEWNQITN